MPVIIMMGHRQGGIILDTSCRGFGTIIATKLLGWNVNVIVDVHQDCTIGSGNSIVHDVMNVFEAKYAEWNTICQETGPDREQKMRNFLEL